MEEKISLITLGLGIRIGFDSIVTVMILWNKAKLWVAPPSIQPFYGVYEYIDSLNNQKFIYHITLL